MNKEVEEMNKRLARLIIEDKQTMNEQFLNKIKELQAKVNQLEKENRKLINNKYDTIYLIQDLACYDRETNSYCNGIKYYDVHKIIEELEGGSNE
jgi:hypothetical protein